MKRLIALALVALVTACATPAPPLNTPSGKAEYMYKNVTKKQVTDAIVAGGLAKGSMVKAVTDYSVVLAKRMDNNTMAQMLFGSRYDGVPEARVTVNLVDVAGGVQAYAKSDIVTNPGSSFERVQPFNADAELQKSLEDIARRLGQ